MKCLLDLDGVLCDFVTGICAAHNSPNVYDNPANAGKYAMEELLGLSATQFWKPCDEAFWAGLPRMRDFQQILSLVEDAFGQENVCLLTSPSVNEGCATGKIRWIYEHLPAYKRRFLIGPPKHFCAHDGAVLIDDYDTNIAKFQAAGGHAIIVPRRWNSMHDVGEPLNHLRCELDKYIHSVGCLDG